MLPPLSPPFCRYHSQFVAPSTLTCEVVRHRIILHIMVFILFSSRFSSPAFSTVCSFVPHFQSCFSQPCSFGHVFSVSLIFCAEFSSLAFSTPCRFVPHFPVLHFHVSNFQRQHFVLFSRNLFEGKTWNVHVDFSFRLPISRCQWRWGMLFLVLSS